MKIGIGAAIACCLVACSTPHTASLVEPIVGGTDDSHDTAIVASLAHSPSSPANDAIICTASVVSPHVVLTAAHCVAPAAVGQGAQYKIFLGDNSFDPQQMVTKNYANVMQVVVHPQFAPATSKSAYDVAVLISSTALTTPLLSLNHTDLATLPAHALVRIVGFGITSAGDTTSEGTRREALTTLGSFDSNTLTISDAVHEACDGDSGSPALITIGGREVIAGVLTTGDASCAQALYNRVDTVIAPFVEPLIAQHDPSVDLGTPEDASSPALDLGSGMLPGSGGCEIATGGGTPVHALLLALAVLFVGRKRRTAG